MDSSGELDDDMILVIVGDEDSSGMRSLQEAIQKESIVSDEKVTLDIEQNFPVAIKEEPVSLLCNETIKEEPQDFYQQEYPSEFENLLSSPETNSERNHQVRRSSRPKKSTQKSKTKNLKDSAKSSEFIMPTTPSLSTRRTPKPNPKYTEYMTDLAKSSTKKSKKDVFEKLLESDESSAPSSWFKSTKQKTNLKTKRKSVSKDESYSSPPGSDIDADPSSELEEDLLLKGLNLERKSIKKEKEQIDDLQEDEFDQSFDNNDAPPSPEVQDEQTRKRSKRKSLKKKDQCEELDETSDNIASSTKFRSGRRTKRSSDCNETEIEKVRKKPKKQEKAADKGNSPETVMNLFFQFQDLRRGFTPNPKSYVAELVKKQPKLANDSEKLINELSKAMKQVKPPPLPLEYCITNKAGYECIKCGHLTETLPAASRHYCEKHGPRYLICFACGVDFRSTTNLYKHEKRCIAPDAAVVLKARARVLGAKARGRPYLSEVPKKKSTYVKGEFPCALCSAKFSSNAWLVAHMNTHLGLRPYVCDECGVAYSSSTTLSKHKKTHSDQEYICDHCKRSFKVKSNLVTHLYTHEPLRRFPCAECRSRFASRAALQAHERSTHRGLPPPVRCALCDSRFPRTWHLKRHMLRVHGMHIMTRKMFYKRLPTMTETQLKEARVIAKADLKDTDDEVYDHEELYVNPNAEDDSFDVTTDAQNSPIDFPMYSVDCEGESKDPQEHDVEKGYKMKILKDGSKAIVIELKDKRIILNQATRESGDDGETTEDHR